MRYLLPQIENWDHWSRIFTDLDLWKPVVSAICSTERIAYSSIETGYPGTNAVFILDRRYVVKIYNPVWKDLAAEREVHVRLLQDGTVPVPGIVSSGTFEHRIGWDYLITEFVDGAPLREFRDSIGPSDLVRISSNLGEIVRALHDTTGPIRDAIIHSRLGFAMVCVHGIAHLAAHCTAGSRRTVPLGHTTFVPDVPLLGRIYDRCQNHGTT